MYKIVFAIILLSALLLMGCNSEIVHQTENIAENISVYDIEPTALDEGCENDVAALTIETVTISASETTPLPLHKNIVSETWQKAYAELLYLYMETAATEPYMDWYSWYFILHDIDLDGIPELFIRKVSLSGHVRHFGYTFLTREVVSLSPPDYSQLFGSLFVLTNDCPEIFLFSAAGSGGWYTQMIIAENSFVIIAEGVSHLSEEGLEREYKKGANFDFQNYEWYDLFINGYSATVEEFEYVFGGWHERERLESFEITEANIQEIIFGWQPKVSTINTSTSGLAVAGVITGEVYYKDIAIGRLFVEPFFNVLGEPWGNRDNFFFYDNFQVMSSWCYGLESTHRGVAIHLFVREPNLSMFEINGITLNMTRSELIAAFGNPLNYYSNPDWEYHNETAIGYDILSPIIDYHLVFRFVYTDDKMELPSIGIIPRVP